MVTHETPTISHRQGRQARQDRRKGPDHSTEIRRCIDRGPNGMAKNGLCDGLGELGGLGGPIDRGGSQDRFFSVSAFHRCRCESAHRSTGLMSSRARKMRRVGVNPFRNPMRTRQASNQDPTKSMAAEESDPNFKKDPCRSVCIRVQFRCDVAALRRGPDPRRRSGRPGTPFHRNGTRIRPPIRIRPRIRERGRRPACYDGCECRKPLQQQQRRTVVRRTRTSNQEAMNDLESPAARAPDTEL